VNKQNKKLKKKKMVGATYMFQPSNLSMKTGDFIVQVHGINS